MREWEQLVSASLLGTERQAPKLPTSDGALGAALASVDPAAPLAPLSAAALLATYRWAGWTPTTEDTPPSAVSAADAQPVCNAASAGHLALMLEGQFRDVLPEWLAAADRAGRRAPPEALPQLLDRGRAQKELRPLIQAVIGERGRWLAAQNPDWDYSADVLTASDWETGSREARAALLQRLRTEDPDAARELLQGTWAQETPEDRARFLGLLVTGLSDADEPLLENCLDDRRKEVRSTAADLLARLPGSALCRRMMDRLRPLVAMRKVFMLKLTLDVQLPAECDKAMQRDGIEPKPPAGKKLGEKAWWLHQMAGSVPPRFWVETLNLTPRVFLELVQKNEWSSALVDGVAEAAVRVRDATWAEAILEARPELDSLRQCLVGLLPPQQREAQALQVLLSTNPPRLDDAALQAIAGIRDPWSPQLTRTVLQALRRRAATSSEVSDWQIRTSLKEWARLMPPSMLAEAETGWPADGAWKTWQSSVDDFLTVLQFRHDMLQEISR